MRQLLIATFLFFPATSLTNMLRTARLQCLCCHDRKGTPPWRQILFWWVERVKCVFILEWSGITSNESKTRSFSHFFAWFLMLVACQGWRHFKGKIWLAHSSFRSIFTWHSRSYSHFPSPLCYSFISQWPSSLAPPLRLSLSSSLDLLFFFFVHILPRLTLFDSPGNRHATLFFVHFFIFYIFFFRIRDFISSENSTKGGIWK